MNLPSSTADLPPEQITGSRSSRALRTTTQALFVALLVLLLLVPSLRSGPFTWLPLLRLPMLAGRPAQLGVASLLPLLVAASWMGWRLLERPRRRLQWGPTALTLPLAGLSLLVVAGLDLSLTWRTAVQVGGVGLFWLTYLVTINEQPRLALVLALVLLVQGGVAVGQFWLQGDLGLAAWGELPLDPAQPGVSVIAGGGQRWLRAYGLTAHPNMLGAMLGSLLLLFIPHLRRGPGWQQWLRQAIFLIGLLGLLACFSRGAWLGFAAGLGLLAAGQVVRGRRLGQPRLHRQHLLYLLPIAIALLFLAGNADLVLGRFLRLDSPLEARSINERLRDARLAVEVFRANPWLGVGAANYEVAAQSLDPNAGAVHNIPLLAAAELGGPGVLLWLWLVVAPFVVVWKRAAKQRVSPKTDWAGWAARLAPWVAMLAIGTFDTTLWFTTSWRAAVLFALLASWVAASAGSEGS